MRPGIEARMSDPLPHCHRLGQHEELGETLHGGMRGDAGHRDEEREGGLQCGLRPDERDRLAGEQRDAALEMADIDLDIVAGFRRLAHPPDPAPCDVLPEIDGTPKLEYAALRRSPAKDGRHRMKRSKFSEEQVAYALRQAEAGSAVGDVCRQLGISEATFWGPAPPGRLVRESEAGAPALPARRVAAPDASPATQAYRPAPRPRPDTRGAAGTAEHGLRA